MAKIVSRYTRIRTTVTITNYCWEIHSKLLVPIIMPHKHSYPVFNDLSEENLFYQRIVRT